MQRTARSLLLASGLLLLGGMCSAQDRVAAPKSPAATRQLTPAQLAKVLERAAALERKGRLDAAVSLLQRSLLWTDDPTPRFRLAAVHAQRARLYRNFADAARTHAPRQAAEYVRHAKSERAAAERLRALGRQLLFDRVDADGDGRISQAEGAALLRRLGATHDPQVRLAGLSDVAIAILSAAAAATSRAGLPLVVSAIHGDAVALRLPTARRAAALRTILKTQLRDRGVPVGSGGHAIDVASSRLRIHPHSP